MSPGKDLLLWVLKGTYFLSQHLVGYIWPIYSRNTASNSITQLNNICITYLIYQFKKYN